MAKKKSTQIGTKKSPVKRQSGAVGGSQVPTKGVPGGEQDTKRRLGNFTSAGEHARIGGRTSGIVGQTTKHSRTDQKKK
jgi:hypothetical protein